MKKRDILELLKDVGDDEEVFIRNYDNQDGISVWKDISASKEFVYDGYIRGEFQGVLHEHDDGYGRKIEVRNKRSVVTIGMSEEGN